MTVYIYDRF